MATIVSKEYSAAVLAAVAGASASVFSGDFEVALLSGAPSVTSGTIDISSVELSGSGYSRITVPVEDFGSPTGHDPVVVSNSNVLYSSFNSSGSAWDSVTHVALLQSDVVLQVIDLASPVEVDPEQRVKISVGGLQIKLSSE